MLAVTAFIAGVPTPIYAIYEHQYHFASGVLVAVSTIPSRNTGRRGMTSFGVALGVCVAVLYVLTNHTPTPPGGEGRSRGTA